MKFTFRFGLKILLVLLVGCGADDSVKLVSMSALLSTPEKFDGERVAVVGYLGRGADVYLTEEHARVDDRNSALILNVSDEKRERIISSECAGRHVEVIGIFRLVRLPGLTPRLGIENLSSIADKVTRIQCVPKNSND